MFRVISALLLLNAAACAGNLDVTGASSVLLEPGVDLVAQFGVWNYGANNPGVSPAPTTIGVEIIGPAPEGVAAAWVPGTTLQYLPGFAMEVDLESLNGGISIPFLNDQSARLNIADTWLTPALGSVSVDGGSRDAAIFSATLRLSNAQAEAVFGPDLGSFNSAAVIRAHNIGESLRIGLGEPYSLQNAILEPGIGGAGPIQTAGIPGTIMLSTSEPPTMLLSFATFLVALVQRRSRERIRRAIFSISSVFFRLERDRTWLSFFSSSVLRLSASSTS